MPIASARSRPSRIAASAAPVRPRNRSSSARLTYVRATSSGAAVLLGQRERPPQAVLAGVRVAVEGEGDAELGPRPALLGARARRHGDGRAPPRRSARASGHRPRMLSWSARPVSARARSADGSDPSSSSARSAASRERSPSQLS